MIPLQALILRGHPERFKTFNFKTLKSMRLRYFFPLKITGETWVIKMVISFIIVAGLLFTGLLRTETINDSDAVQMKSLIYHESVW